MSGEISVLALGEPSNIKVHDGLAQRLCVSSNTIENNAAELNILPEDHKSGCPDNNMGLVTGPTAKILSKSINRLEFTEMAWNGLLSAVEVARLSRQKFVKSKHLMKALLEQKDGLALRILTQAGLEEKTVLWAVDEFVQQRSKIIFFRPKWSGDSKVPKLGRHLISLLDKAKKLKKKFGDDVLSVEHLLLAFNLEKRFGKRLFKKLELSEKQLKNAIDSIRQNLSVTEQYTEGQFKPLEKYGKDLTELARNGNLDSVEERKDEIAQCIQMLSTWENPIIITESGIARAAIVAGVAQQMVGHRVPAKLLNKKLISLDMGSLIADSRAQGDYLARLEAFLKEVVASNNNIILYIDDVHTVAARVVITGEAKEACAMFNLMVHKLKIHFMGATTLNEYKKYIGGIPALEMIIKQVFCNQLSAEDTILLLRKLRERYELCHGVKISDSALVSAAVLVDRFLTESVLPDKAIDLVDEASAKLKKEKTSKLSQCVKIDREVTELKEKLSFVKDTSKVDKEWLSKLVNDVDMFKEETNKLMEQWECDKSLTAAETPTIKEVDQAKLEGDAAESVCDYDLNHVVVLEIEQHLEKVKNEFAELKKSWETLRLQEGVTDLNIVEMVSKWSGIPLSNLQQSEKDKVRTLEEVLKQRVPGMIADMESVYSTICRKMVIGEEDPNRPFASFLFMGASCVDKIEVAKALVVHLFNTQNALVKIDLRECMRKVTWNLEEDFVSCLGRELVEVMHTRRRAVLLFEEIESAHSDLFNVLTLLLENTRRIDRRVNLANSIVIMTSNIGSHVVQDTLTSKLERCDYAMQVSDFAERLFSSEFVNVIDRVIVFRPMKYKGIGKMVEIKLKRLKDRLKERKIHLHYTMEVVNVLDSLGYDQDSSPLLLKNLMNKAVNDVIAHGLLNDDFEENDSIVLDVVSPFEEGLPPKQKVVVRKL